MEARKTSSGNSLNELLTVGPKIQDDLFDHILSFRMHKVVVCGERAKMYRQVALAHDDKEFHRILWRSGNGKVEEYRMTRVTYGIASSSYHAIRSLQEAARDAPEAVKRAITRDFYVDDLCAKQNSPDAKKNILAFHSHLLKYEMPIRKWASSDAAIIAELPVELRQDELAFNISDKDHVVKTLGLKWIPSTRPSYDIWSVAKMC